MSVIAGAVFIKTWLTQSDEHAWIHVLYRLSNRVRLALWRHSVRSDARDFSLMRSLVATRPDWDCDPICRRLRPSYLSALGFTDIRSARLWGLINLCAPAAGADREHDETGEH